MEGTIGWTPAETKTPEGVEGAVETARQQETMAAVQHLFDYNCQVSLASPLVTPRGVGLQTLSAGLNTLVGVGWRVVVDRGLGQG